MPLKRTLLLAITALMAVALVGPAHGSAADWTHEGEPIEEEAEAQLSGIMGFKSSLLGGFECETHVPIILEPEGAGTATAFDFTSESCVGSGLLASCETTHVTVTSLPSKLTVTVLPKAGLDFSPGTLDIHVEFGGGCAVEGVTYTFDEGILATPENPKAISKLSLAGEGIVDAGMEFPSEAYGSLLFTPGETYGIG